MWNPQLLYSNYLLHQPNILFGNNSFYGLADYPCSKVAIFSSSAVDNSTKSILEKIFKKKSVYFVERSWKKEPDLEGLKGSISELEKISPDLIIAIGGGSVIDGAKLCRLFYEFPYYEVGITKVSSCSFKTNFIAIPTTLGSGAEISSAAVYINKNEKCKEMIINPELIPSVIVFNSVFFTHSLNAVDIVKSSLDAICHVIEGYLSKRKNELAEILAEKSLSIFFHELSKSDYKYLSFERLQYAGYLGGIVQNHCIVGVVHSLSHQLSEYGFSHSEAISIILPSVLSLYKTKENIKSKIDSLCDFAGLLSTEHLITFIKELSSKAELQNRKIQLIDVLSKLIDDEQFITNVIEDISGSESEISITKEFISEIFLELKNGL